MKTPDYTYRADVTRVEGGVYVTVPKLGMGVEYGPCETLAPVTPGQKVLVTTVNGIPEDLVVLGVLA